MLRFVVTIAGEPESMTRSVVVFQANDSPDANSRALEIGRSMEERYIGGTGDEVMRRLDRVETLDRIGDNLTDGRELYSEMIDLPSDWQPGGSPEAIPPTQSGV